MQLTLDGNASALEEFRPVHYLGNKSKVLDAIDAIVKRMAPPGQPVCDLFAGSGVVARRLALSRPVVASDIQEYSRVLTSALLNPVPISSSMVARLISRAEEEAAALAVGPLRDLMDYEATTAQAASVGSLEQYCELVENGSLAAWTGRPTDRPSRSLARLLSGAVSALAAGPMTVLTRYYGGVYFSYEQAAKLDSLVSAARALNHPYRTAAVAAALSTASEMVSTVGNQFAQPIQPRGRDGQPKPAALSFVARQRMVDPSAIFRKWLTSYGSLRDTGFNHDVSRSDFRAILRRRNPPIAIVYADPPYTRDHYSRFYHVLETIALGDEPAISPMKAHGEQRLSRALYRTERHQSPFCIKSQSVPAFRDLFNGVRQMGVPLVLSYSPYGAITPARANPRLITIDALVDLAGEYFCHVEVESAGRVAHSKFNREELNGVVAYDAEVFLIATP